MPIYLKTIGFSVVLIGILEGVAEATAGLSKGYFGKMSDNAGRRVPFVQLGYAFSAISKPMMALFVYPLWIFFARTLDRIGKGIRTGARDAILSDEATPETKGKIFGFHRSMDTLGAVLGPSLALLYLYYYPEDYRTLFFIAFVPGLLAVVSTLILKEKKAVREPKPKGNRPNPKGKDSHPKAIETRSKAIRSAFSFLKYWKESPPQYRRVVIGMLLFTLFNSSDVFLLLQAKQAGFDDSSVIGVYIFYNLIYALFAFPVGIIADKVGLKTIFILGLALFAVVYFGMAFNTNLYLFLGLFFLYGIYAAATDGISKAWISNIADKKDTATAIGTYSGFQSICTMLASSLTGFIWFQFGAAAAFLTVGIATVVIIFYFLTLPTDRRH